MRIEGGRVEPGVLRAILDWRPTGFLARLTLVGGYLLGGIAKASDWQAAAEQAIFGMQSATLWTATTIAIQFVGPAPILTGRLVWQGAGISSVFTLLAAITANPFWAMPADQYRFMANNAFFEHLGLFSGFVLVAMLARQAASERPS